MLPGSDTSLTVMDAPVSYAYVKDILSYWAIKNVYKHLVQLQFSHISALGISHPRLDCREMGTFRQQRIADISPLA